MQRFAGDPLDGLRRARNDRTPEIQQTTDEADRSEPAYPCIALAARTQDLGNTHTRCHRAREQDQTDDPRKWRWAVPDTGIAFLVVLSDQLG